MSSPGSARRDRPLVVVATDPDVQRVLCEAFDVRDPWAIAGLVPPSGGPWVRGAAALADFEMVTRLAARLDAPRVAVVLGDPIEQCRRHFEHNQRQGIEWRPIELAVAHETALARRLVPRLDVESRVEGVFPLFAYTTLAKHRLWLQRWADAFGDRLLLEHRYQPSSTIPRLEEHFDTALVNNARAVRCAGEPDAAGDQVWSWIKGTIDA